MLDEFQPPSWTGDFFDTTADSCAFVSFDFFAPISSLGRPKQINKKKKSGLCDPVDVVVDPKLPGIFFFFHTAATTSRVF